MNKLLSRRASLLACAALVAAAPLHAQRARDPLLLSDKPAPREGCVVAARPNPLPSLATLADSASLAAGMNEFARDFPIRDGKMFGVYSVAFAANGTVERVAAVDYFLPQGHEPDFATLIRTALRPQQPGAPWSVRVRVEPGAETVFRVGRSEVCEPRSRSSFQLATPAFSRIQRPVPMRVQVRIATNGQIRAINILRPSGDNELDRWVQDVLLRRSFQPGLVDGTEVEMEREETVRFTYRP